MSNERSTPALTSDELSVLCWQLGLLCRAGVSWAESAPLLLEERQPPRVKALLEQLSGHLQENLPLSDAMEAGGGFPAYLLRMVSIGQAAGRLDQVLSGLAGYYKREAHTKEALRRAVTYPAVMAALIALVFLVLVQRVLPVFSQVFAQLGTGPLSLGGAAQVLSWVLAGALLAGSLVLLLLFRGDRGMSLFRRGAAAQAVARGRFSSAMALMLRSGLSLDEAMDRTAELLTGSPLEAPMARCREQMAQGGSFPQAVESAGVLTGLQAGLIAAGFRSGAAEEAMEELAQRCQAEADDRLERMLSRFEYALVLVLCLAVGLVLLWVMLPLLGVLSAIGG